MGADITYTCVGINPNGSFTYNVRYSLYRDCDGISAPSSVPLRFSSSCYPALQTVNLLPIPSSPTEISPNCSTVSNTCDVPQGTYTGIEEWIYEGTITLPGPCADWVLYHTLSARNQAITTIANPGSNNLHVYSLINNTGGICNSSPIFSNRPVPFPCQGQNFRFNHGAYDADGDSLTYELITPRNGPLPGDTITYMSGYSRTQPLTSAPPMTFNASTGDFFIVPQTVPEVTVMAVLVSEWRNGVLIGQVERDIQVTVINCNNLIPSLTGLNGSPVYQTQVCAGSELCFWIRSVDLDPTDTTIITWDNAIPNATFTTYGGRRDSASFCWTPTFADVSNTPYCFTATVEDNSCPYLGIQVYAYCITVNGVDANAGPDQTIPCGATANLAGSALGNGNITYVWNPGNDTSQTQTGVPVGTYILTVSSGNCSDTDTMQVLPGQGVPAATFSFTSNCSGLPVQFTDLSTVSGSTINTWLWDFDDGTTSNAQSPTHQFPGNGTYNVSLTVTTPTNCTSTIVQQVVVNTNVPQVNFTANNVCDGTPMNFSDQSTGTGNNSWSWNFGDPSSPTNTSSTQHPNHTFTTAGTYSVTLVVSNSSGCQGQSQQTVTVNANPVINVPNAGMCAGTQATLNGPGGYPGYSWSSGQTTESITVSPASTTNYTLTVTDGNGCTGSASATVSVDQLPIPNAGMPQTICEGTGANLVGSGGTTYTWNPGNISGSNVTVFPTVTTTYTLTVSSNVGCSAVDDVTINVNPMPLADAGNDLAICEGESITIFSNTSPGSILWTPGNLVTPNITVNPNVTTTYVLSVSDAIGCSGTDTVTLNVNPLPVAQFSNTSPVCQGISIIFNDGSSVSSGNITDWLWDFGDGNTSLDRDPSHQYATAANYNVMLTVTTNGGCLDSTASIAVVNAIPAVDAGLDQSICPGFDATLTGNGNGNFLWSPGGYNTASITLSPPVTTDYILTITDVNGCVNTDVATIVVNPVPVADAGQPVSVCDGEPITLFGNGGTNYTWMPGNVNSQNYSFTPTASATYTLTVENSFGCIDVAQVDVQVNPIPLPAISSTGPVCQGGIVSFTDLSQVTTGSIVAWSWDFGNSTSSSTQNPTIPYFSSGAFNVSLTVYSDNGCEAVTTYNQTIWPTPVASYSHTNVCDGNPVSFNNTSSISDASPLGLSWNLGDNTTSSNSSFNHQYAGYGSYAATLIVNSVNGCADTVVQAVNVYALPVAVMNATYACLDDAAAIFDASTVPQGMIASWFWNLGDQTTSVATHPVHNYVEPGTYNLTLRVVTDHGCVDSTTGVIRIVPPPTVDFLTENKCLGYEVDFTDRSFPSTGPIVQYEWNFGDGNISTDQNPTHMYTQPGFYQVSLRATSDSGCVAQLVRPNALQIYAPPVPNFTSNAAQANDIVPLVDFLNLTQNSVFHYWNFGDGDTSTQYSPEHMYDEVGTYDVQLIAIDQRGCVDSILLRIEIKPTSNVYIPNAFTPNGDASNDIFKVYTHNVAEVEVAIYDRWGLKIVEWNDLFGGWDGRVAGNPAQADTYVYRVATKDVNNKEEVFVGHVSLVR